MEWAAGVRENFEQMIAKMPIFLRPTAVKALTAKAETLAAAEGRPQVTEKDMVDAFFAETPFGFHGLMKNDLRTVGVEYTKYGHEE